MDKDYGGATALSYVNPKRAGLELEPSQTTASLLCEYVVSPWLKS